MRARWIKPEFFRGRTMARLGPVTGLVFQALWCMADDGGVAMCDPARIKAEMFLFWEDIDLAAIEASLAQLDASKSVALYTVGVERYAEIVNWATHQKVHKPSPFRYPRPSQTPQTGTTPALVPHSTGTTPALSATSPPPRHLDTQTPRHPDVGCGTATEEEQPPTATSKPRNDSLAKFDEFWENYPKRAGGVNRQAALRMWDARIGEGIEPVFLIDKARTYGAWCNAEKLTGTRKVMMASTFLGRDRRYEDDFAVTALKLETVSSSGTTAESKPVSREWLRKNGFAVMPLEGGEVA